MINKLIDNIEGELLLISLDNLLTTFSRRTI